MWFQKQTKTELDIQRERYAALKAEREQLELTHALAFESSRIEHLRAKGLPFYTPTPPPAESAPRYHPVPVYETDTATGYPFKDAIHFEQDPPNGYAASPFYGFEFDLGSYEFGIGVPVAAFPRELFPERASSLRTQIAQDAIRLMSRIWYETVPQYSGPIGHLRNYTVGEGMSIEVTSNTDPELAKDLQVFLDEFVRHKSNHLQRRVWEAALNLFRDGESLLRIYPGKDLPEIRAIDTSWLRGPHSEIQGPWAFGILTDWPYDYENAQAYNLWLPNNKQELVSPKEIFLAKLDTVGANVKRGVPLAYKIRKQIPQLSRLLDAMALGEASRQSIAYIQQYPIADSVAVRQSIQSSLDAQCQGPTNYGHYDQGRHEIHPGQVEHINKGQQFVDPPIGNPGQGTEVYHALCEAIASALNVPLWFVMADITQENYSSALVAESPVVQLVTHYQRILTDHFEEVLSAVVTLSGRFPPNALETCHIDCKLPSSVSRDIPAEVDAWTTLVNKGCCSPQTLAQKFALDWDEERDLIKKAEAVGWLNTPEKEALSERPTGETAVTAAEKA